MKPKSNQPSVKARRFFWIATGTIVLVLEAYRDGMALRPAPPSKYPQGAVPHVIKAGTDVTAVLLRAICSDSFAVGDTVSAKLYNGHTMLSPLKWWPKELTVVLRRSAPDREAERWYPSLALVRATVNGTVVKGARGVFVTDVETTYRASGKPDVTCYREFGGILTRAIRGH